MDPQKLLVVPKFLVAALEALDAIELEARAREVRLYGAVALVLDREKKLILCLGRWLNGEAEVPDWAKVYNIEAIALWKAGSSLHHEEDTPHEEGLEWDVHLEGGVFHDRFPLLAGVEGSGDVDKEFALMLIHSVIGAIPASSLEL